MTIEVLITSIIYNYHNKHTWLGLIAAQFNVGSLFLVWTSLLIVIAPNGGAMLPGGGGGGGGPGGGPGGGGQGGVLTGGGGGGGGGGVLTGSLTGVEDADETPLEPVKYNKTIKLST